MHPLTYLEEVPDPPGPLSDQHLVELGARGVEEGNPRFTGHRPKTKDVETSHKS